MWNFFFFLYLLSRFYNIKMDKNILINASFDYCSIIKRFKNKIIYKIKVLYCRKKKERNKSKFAWFTSLEENKENGRQRLKMRN